MVSSPLLHGETNFIDRGKETVKPSLCHSYRSSFKRQVITLPLHGQNTAAVELSRHWAGGTSYTLVMQEAMFLVNRRGLGYVCRVPSPPFGLSFWAHQCGVNGFTLDVFLA